MITGKEIRFNESGEKMFEVEKVAFNNVGIRGWIYNWDHDDGRETVIMHIRKGNRAGAHYHEGKDPSKSPERFFIAKGRAKVKFTTEDGPSEFHEKTVGEGEILIIHPKTGHLIEALEDLILVEYRKVPFDADRSDTYASRILAK